jgi:Ca-activated chloride channel family protein
MERKSPSIAVRSPISSGFARLLPAHLPLALALALLILILFAGPAAADGIIIPHPPPHPVRPVPWREMLLTVKYHHVDVTVDNQTATTHVDQVFVNDSGYPVEGTYMFPLPEDAAISSFDMWVDGQKMEGKLLSREQARQIYEDIVRQERDPALLEYVGRGAFQASIFPIPPHGERRIELTYTQVLKQEAGLVHYRYPLNTEKFSAQPLADVAVTVTLQDRAPLRAIYSPSHTVDVTRDGDRRATVRYAAQHVLPDRDFDLYYSVSPDAIAANLLSYKPSGEDGFFLLLVTPPITAAETAVDKDVILVMDTSGSMDGQKLVQAKAAATYVLDHLGAGDRFNIVSFSTATHLFAASPVPLARRAEGLSFIEGLRAQGSTDINRALLEAVTGADPARPTILIFLTDGLPTTGETDPDRIVANVTGATPKSVRLFAFGVGYDVDTVLLDQLSSGLRGTSAYVGPDQAIDEVVSGFYASVSAPVLVDTTLKLDGAVVDDIYPYPLPDLFAGQQLVVAGRYRAGGPVTLRLAGTVNGQARSYTYSDLALAQRGGDDFIAPLWAQRKIGYLLAQVRLHGVSDEAVQEIVALSTRYGIITPYTSFLVEEPSRVLTDAGRQSLSQDLTASANAPSAAPAAGAAHSAPALAGGARSGAQAVERAQVEKQLAGAQAAPAAAATTAPAGAGSENAAGGGTAGEQLRQIGDKAFVLQNGSWLDTAFDASKMQPERIAFGSERYFQLLGEHPEIGPYLALGDRVTVLIDGKAYTVGPEGENAAAPATSTPAPTSQPRSLWQWLPLPLPWGR